MPPKSKKTTTSTRAKSSKSAAKGSSRKKTSSAAAKGKHLVIVESPAKAKTINRYLGNDYIVKASVGHISDLPSKAPKGEGKKHPVPGVDLNNNFTPTYEILPGKKTTVTELKRLAKQASDVYFATDLDREGEAIAWHLARLLNVDPKTAKRVVFNAITARQIKKAFENPHLLDEGKFNAYQARRVLDRIVGYQVSPLLWKKVARGLSAGRVQSVAVRLVVEREREIRAFIPEEYWQLHARFATDPAKAPELVKKWEEFVATLDGNGKSPTNKKRNQWLKKHHALRAQLFSIDGKKADKISEEVCLDAARRAGLCDIKTEIKEDPKAKGPARRLVKVSGRTDPAITFEIKSIESKRMRSKPPAPFITSTLQQTASNKLSFGARKTMRAAQRLYEGVELGKEGSVGLITYMRTDSTFINPDAINMAREYIGEEFGNGYLPEKPNFFTSTNKQAQEAHEAIRPTNIRYTPTSIKKYLKADEYRIYTLIWNRFVACQMTPAQWDTKTVLISRKDEKGEIVFKAGGRTLVFDGFYRVAGLPSDTEQQTIPENLARGAEVSPFSIEAKQTFTTPPPRYSEASLIRKLEEEGIGRPSTYASIIQVIQDRKYVEQIDRRFYATDLGEVVTDMLIEAFPNILDVGYTREMEGHLDEIAEGRLAWVKMMNEFYGPFSENLKAAEENLVHAKATVIPAPDEYRCKECGAPTVYRFGKSGRFMSCSRYPDCKWATPINREGEPSEPEETNVACPKCGAPMQLRKGRFGPFLGCSKYPDCDGILKLDKQGNPVPPSVPPLETDLPCPKCESPLVLRMGKRGPWLSCSKYPKCRGRGAWAKLDEEVKKRLSKLLEEHLAKHPILIIRDLDGKPLTDEKGNPVKQEEEETTEAETEATVATPI